ncbi:MAG: serine/threonine protein kinase [Anaerolineales bacterium]|nr:serine/threonine protein kinase [Anaerolineales bacterium]
MRGLVGKTLDHYLIMAEVGQGGMATVYRAVDNTTSQEVAMKVLSPTIAGDRRFIRRFRREGSLLARMKHPNIVPVLDYGESQGFVYLAMPFVRGKTLAAHLKSNQLKLSEVIKWIEQVADALAYAHSLGVIHRDVKPSNIIIDENNNALLTDFGLARQIEGSNTLTGSMLLGTPAYMSPEQASGEPVEEASDQYSLGIILYQVFTGRLPFDEEAPMATVMMHIQEPVPRPGRFNPSLPDAVERVILKSLAKRPAYRYSSIAALKQAFSAAIAGDSNEKTQVMHKPSDEILQTSRKQRQGGGGLSKIFRWFVAPLLLVAVIGGVWWFQRVANNPVPTATIEVLPVFETPADEAVVSYPEETAVPAVLPTAVQNETCPGLSMFNFQREGSTVSWSLDNSLQQPVQLKNAAFQVPEDNWLTMLALDQVVLLEMDPFSQPDPGAVLEIPADERTIIPAGKTVHFELRYAVSDPLPGYAVELLFDEGCTLQTDW